MTPEEWDGLVAAADTLTSEELADALGMVQIALAHLRTVEVDLATVLGKREGAVQGNLSDGRQFTLKRAADRTAWDHEEWKRDARRQIVNHYAVECGLELIDAAGEVQPIGPLLHEAIAKAQEVHGSTQPRTKALRSLGLYPDNYCTSSPSGWRFNAIKPDTTPETTTTQKD